MKHQLILAFCCKINIESFYIGYSRTIRHGTVVMYSMYPKKKYLYVIQHFEGYITGFELNWLGKILLT